MRIFGIMKNMEAIEIEYNRVHEHTIIWAYLNKLLSENIQLFEIPILKLLKHNYEIFLSISDELSKC